MEAFPDFMKASLNHIDSSQQNTPDIDGYYYEGKDGSQICFWTYFSDRESKENVHEFDEYVLCVEGEYVEIIGEDPIDYEIIDDYADSSKYATVKCKSCGKLYKVNRNPGYRTSFFKWSLI